MNNFYQMGLDLAQRLSPSHGPKKCGAKKITNNIQFFNEP